MCKKDTITIAGRTVPGVNLHFSVGAGGDNGPADVMLIQTMFHYLAHVGGKPMPYIGFPMNELPEITGECDWKTRKAILKFQRRHSRRLLKIDGLIEPAEYENRSIASKDERVMTITLMHLLASEMHWHQPDAHYIWGLIRTMPELRPWLV
ncbi:MAG TPA: hypothetical protein VJL58_00165 [Pyrinomonadaceae bacterium]|nr:hypothetical protein [Pyrinomonadaceae bacterium]